MTLPDRPVTHESQVEALGFAPDGSVAWAARKVTRTTVGPPALPAAGRRDDHVRAWLTAVTVFVLAAAGVVALALHLAFGAWA